MQKTISDNFNGMCDLQEIGSGEYDSFFNVHDNIVTLIPLNDDCREKVNILSNNDGSNEKKQWLHGISEDGCSIAFLKTTHLYTTIPSLRTAIFGTPIMVKSITENSIDVKTFNAIEFRGGIVDILYTPALAIEENYQQNQIVFRDKGCFTKKYNVEINSEKFEITYSISCSDLTMETGKVPDLRKSIHSIIRFDFATEKSLDDIEKYYSYAMQLFQFCTGRLNVNFEIRLYKSEIHDGGKVINSSPILVKFQNGFDDYANDILNITQVIRLNFLGNNFPKLMGILNEKKKQPYLLFLPKRNKYINVITYTDVSDICVAFEQEYSLSKTNDKCNEQKEAKALTKELLEIINKKDDCSEPVKKKAINILNSQLKSFSPSLKEKIISLYEEFMECAKPITEKKGHDIHGISKFYSQDEFKRKVSKFVEIRNKASHAGIVWNDGIEIFSHLKLIIYFSVLKRAGYSSEESCSMLSELFGRDF